MTIRKAVLGASSFLLQISLSIFPALSPFSLLSSKEWLVFYCLTSSCYGCVLPFLLVCLCEYVCQHHILEELRTQWQPAVMICSLFFSVQNDIQLSNNILVATAVFQYAHGVFAKCLLFLIITQLNALTLL